MDGIVSVFIYHSKGCKHASDRYSKKCKCPKWLYEHTTRRRYSARTRSWAQATDEARKREKEIATGLRPLRQGYPLQKAIELFMEALEARNLSQDHLERYVLWLDKRFLPWCLERGLTRLSDITAFTQFRASWDVSPITTRKTTERFSSFFKHCVAYQWMEKSPTLGLQPIKVSGKQTDYFTREEYKKILQAVNKFSEGQDGMLRSQQRVLTMIELLRWSGLRITEAACLERRRLEGDNLMLYTSKTGTHVFVPLPPTVAKLLRSVPPAREANADYFFWSGQSKRETQGGDWWDKLKKVFDLADLQKRCHPHMLRDTFAVELLLSGVSLEEVSLLLGHKSVKITEKHYAPWVKARQDKLSESVKKSWSPPTSKSGLRDGFFNTLTWPKGEGPAVPVRSSKPVAG
jgi:integrase/recombinase XerD